MFGEAIDGGKSISEQATAEVSLSDSATKWEYKFKDKDDDIKGPLSTDEMERVCLFITSILYFFLVERYSQTSCRYLLSAHEFREHLVQHKTCRL